MIQQRTVLMSEFSDIRYDARVLKQANTLAENGFIVYLIMYNSEISTIEEKKINNILKISIPFPKRYDTKSIIQRFSRLAAFLMVMCKYFYKIIKLKTDYYHAHNFFVGWIVYLSCVIHKGKFIYDIHELQWEGTNFQRIIGVKVEKYLLHKAAIIICPSDDRAKLLADFYKLKNSPISLFNYPSEKETDIGFSIPLRHLLHEELSLPINIKIIFYSGMLSVATRLQDNIIKALPKIPSNVVFVIVGYGHQHEIKYLKSVAKIYNVEERVFILGPKPHSLLLDYTRSSDIGVSILKNNRISFQYHALNKFYEYVSAGLSVIASDFPTFRNDVYNNPVGQIGITCDEENPQSIADGINSILSDSIGIRKYKENSSNLFTEYWNWEKQEEKLLTAYKAI